MIEAEKKQGADYATDALLWLKRFYYHFIEKKK
jgi:hypothetical protein